MFGNKTNIANNNLVGYANSGGLVKALARSLFFLEVLLLFNPRKRIFMFRGKPFTLLSGVS